MARHLGIDEGDIELAGTGTSVGYELAPEQRRRWGTDSQE